MKWLISLLILISSACNGHELNFSFLELKPSDQKIQVNWYLSAMDLQQSFDLDTDKDGRVMVGEIKKQRLQIASSLNRIIKLDSEAQCNWLLEEIFLDPSKQQMEMEIQASADCVAPPSSLTFNFQNDTETGARQTVLYKLGSAEGILSSMDPILSLNENQSGNQFIAFLKEGVIHILIGLDHLLFLALLVFSLLVVSEKEQFKTGKKRRSIALQLLIYTGCFALAHSITLSLGAMNLAPVSTKWVEVFIALTVLYSAIKLYHHGKPLATWTVFLFGLVHGFGFASVFADLTAHSALSWVALGAFNLGVELGQLIFVAGLMACIAFLSNHRIVMISRVSSILISILASLWLFERVSGVAVF